MSSLLMKTTIMINIKFVLLGHWKNTYFLIWKQMNKLETQWTCIIKNERRQWKYTFTISLLLSVNLYNFRTIWLRLLLYIKEEGSTVIPTFYLNLFQASCKQMSRQCAQKAIIRYFTHVYLFKILGRKEACHQNTQ